MFSKIWSRLVQWLSAEWILQELPNGGSVITFRAMWITSIATVASIAASDVVCPARQFAFTIDWGHGANFVVMHGKEIAAIFGGVYLALYARFASQWAYLAAVYNQIMQTKAGSSETNRAAMAAWEAGFVEDAVALHLHRKEMFAEAVLHIIAKPFSRVLLEKSLGAKKVGEIRDQSRAARRTNYET